MSDNESSIGKIDKINVGDEILGDEILGDEILGDEILGDEILGDEILGDEILGDNYVSIEKLSQKIHRYIKQRKFSDAHMRYIIHLCRLEDDHYNETKTGVHLNLGKYSKETTQKLKDFIEKCEASWKEDENDELIMKKKDRGNQTVEFFKKRTDESSIEPVEPDEKPKLVIQTDTNQNQSNMMINFGVDNKKIPLNKYKGIFQRIMRKSRAIKNFKPILNEEKRKTTETLVLGEERVFIQVEKEEENEEENEEEEYEYEEEEYEEENEEENEEDCEDENEENEENIEEEEDEEDEEEEEDEEISSIEEDDSDEFKDSDSSKELDRADLDDLDERYN
jgi:hypothetical protein